MTRESDLIGRWGGEEFLGILTGATLQAGRQYAERARAAVSALDTPAGQVTISVGVSSGVCANLVEQADEKLYEAKRTGRNRVCA